MSRHREKSWSIQPPRKPALVPTRAAKKRQMRVAAPAMRRELRPP
jgi:hypothetical protein